MFLGNKDKKNSFWGLGAALSVTVTVTVTVASAIILSCTGCSKGGSQTLDYENLYRVQKREKLSFAQLIEKSNRCYLSSPDSSLAYLNIIMGQYNPDMPLCEQKQYARACLKLGSRYFFDYANYAQAYEYLLRSQDICEKYGFDEYLPQIYFDLANVYTIFGNHNEGEEHYKEALRRSIEQQKWDICFGTMANLLSEALLHRKLERFVPEMDLFMQADIPEDYPGKKYYTDTYKAFRAALDRNYAEAEHYFDLMARYAGDSAEDIRMKVFALLNKNEILEMQGKYTEAISTSVKLLPLLEKEEGLEDMRMENYANLAKYYNLTGNHVLSVSYKDKSVNLKDSILNFATLSQIHSMKSQHQMDKFNEQFRRAELRRQRQNSIICAMLVFLVIVLSFLIISLIQNRKLNQKNVELYHKHEALLEKTRENPLPPSPKSILSEEKQRELAAKIRHIMEEGEEVFSPDFSEQRLITLLESNYRYVGLVMKEIFKQSFSDYLAQCRINEACRRITDRDRYGNLTLEAIGNSLGYKSKSNFYSNFRKITGLTPAQYRDISIKEKRQ